MPIYEYECTCCSCRFELKQSFDEDPLVSCPQCGSDALRIFSPVPIIFKGSGFYSTDNRQNYHDTDKTMTDTDKTMADNKKKTGREKNS